MDFNTAKQIENQHYFDVFARYDICFTHGKGSKLFDTEGKEYIDFLGGIAVNSLGYGDELLIGEITNQAKKLMHVSNLFYNQPQAKLVKRLTEDTGFDKVFLCNSGAEANEAAIKLVRKNFYNKGSERYKIVTALNSFHGRTITTAAATGQPKYSDPYKPLTPGFIYVPYNDIDALESVLEDQTVGAVMLETIQGEGGVVPATKKYLQAVRRLTYEREILLVIDEVQTGILRCGKLFSFENYDILPDIITLAKGLGGGFPIGAMLANGEVANAFTKGDHGSTFGGNPLACAAANAVLDRVLEKNFTEEVNFKANFFKQILTRLIRLSCVKEIRGQGLLLGVKLDDSINGRDIVKKMLDIGFIINCAGDNTLRFAPPLVVTTNDIEKLVNALFKTLSDMECAL